MQIGGFQKQSLIDYPGNISAVIFTQGCNFRCGYCHNPKLVLPDQFEKPLSEEEIFRYLKHYSNLLDAVCITGGEPTLHNDLPEFIEKIKSLGLKVKLDTNGTNPSMLKQLISSELIDFVAMDIKHMLSPLLYSKAVGINLSLNSFKTIIESLTILQTSNIKHEFRTTVVKGIHDDKDIRDLMKLFDSELKLQPFRATENIINPQLAQGSD